VFDVPASDVAFIHLTKAQFTLLSVNFVSADAVVFLFLENAVSVRLDSCAFTWPDSAPALAFDAVNSPDIKLVSTSFNVSGRIANLTNSLVMAAFCCLRQEGSAPLAERFASDAPSVVHEGTGVAFHKECPWQELTETLSAEEQAYAIATVVIFFLCFAVLFIGLIVFVFCKARKEEVEYAEVPQDPNAMEEGDMDIPST
jgi:cbb3-type cytochrome oxidase subunit 3